MAPCYTVQQLQPAAFGLCIDCPAALACFAADGTAHSWRSCRKTIYAPHCCCTCASSSTVPSPVAMALISLSSRLKPSCTSRVNTSTWLLAVLLLSNETSSALEWYLQPLHIDIKPPLRQSLRKLWHCISNNLCCMLWFHDPCKALPFSINGMTLSQPLTL